MVENVTLMEEILGSAVSEYNVPALFFIWAK